MKKRRTTDYCNVEVEEAEEGRRKDKQGSFRLSKVDGGENVRSVAGMCLAGCRLPVTSLAANTAQRYVCSIGNFLSFPSSAGKIKTRSSRRVIVDRWPKDYQRIEETCLSASLSFLRIFDIRCSSFMTRLLHRRTVCCNFFSHPLPFLLFPSKLHEAPDEGKSWLHPPTPSVPKPLLADCSFTADTKTVI